MQVTMLRRPVIEGLPYQIDRHREREQESSGSSVRLVARYCDYLVGQLAHSWWWTGREALSYSAPLQPRL